MKGVAGQAPAKHADVVLVWPFALGSSIVCPEAPTPGPAVTLGVGTFSWTKAHQRSALDAGSLHGQVFGAV